MLCEVDFQPCQRVVLKQLNRCGRISADTFFSSFVLITFRIFLGGKTCCAFDCTPNVDKAIEDKIKDRQKLRYRLRV